MVRSRSKLYFRRFGYTFCINLEGELTTKQHLQTFIPLILYSVRDHESTYRPEGEENNIRKISNTAYLCTVIFVTKHIHI
jgi:hypothetical protein